MRVAEAKRLGLKPEPLVPWVLHDFRRAGVSKLASMGIDSIVADKLLAHAPAKLRGVTGVYQRHAFIDERKRALEAWASFLINDRNAATVLPFAKGGA